jgi:hypothetical protein
MAYAYEEAAQPEPSAAASPAVPGSGEAEPWQGGGPGLAQKKAISPDKPESGEPPKARRSPLLIYTAHLQLAVFETDKALSAAEDLMRQAQGYLVHRTQSSITFRVPAAGFGDVVDKLAGLGDVLHRDVKARDVTEEFHDINTRLESLEAMRKRLEELLARAQKVEEALAVERELGRIISQIEQLKGKLKLMSELIAFSTITVNLQPRVVESAVESTFNLPFPWLQTLGLGPLLSL